MFWNQSNSKQLFLLWEKFRGLDRIAGRALEPNSYSELPNTMLHVVGTGDEMKGGLVAGNDTNRG